MALRDILPVLVPVLLILPTVVYTEDDEVCKLVATNSSLNVRKCLLYRYIRIANRKVDLGVHNERIPLEEPRRDVLIYCDKYSSIYSWKFAKKDGNQIRVTFVSGYLHIQIYMCSNLDGPPKAGIRCAVEAFSSACPGHKSHNHTCVYEVKTHRFSGSTVRTSVEVSTEIGTMVRKLVGLSGGVSYTKERIKVKTYTVRSRSYIVIPAGYRFCSFSEVVSVVAYLAPTGFSWRCKLPSFYQTNLDVRTRCSNLTRCKDASLCDVHVKAGDSADSGAKSTVASPFDILFFLSIFTMFWDNFLDN